MEVIKFSLNKQKISLIDCPIIASNSKDYLYASFELESDDWVKPIIAIFISEEKVPFSVTLDDDNMCKVPWEVLQYGNKVEVSAVCGDLHTATSVTFAFENSGYRNGNEPLEPTPTIWSELSKKIDSKQDKLIAGSITTENIASKAVTMEKLADDVTHQFSKLKDDIGDIPQILNSTVKFAGFEVLELEWMEGVIDSATGNVGKSKNNAITDFIPVSILGNEPIYITPQNGCKVYIYKYDADKNYTGIVANGATKEVVIIPDSPYYRFMLHKTDGTKFPISIANLCAVSGIKSGTITKELNKLASFTKPSFLLNTKKEN